MSPSWKTPLHRPALARALNDPQGAADTITGSLPAVMSGAHPQPSSALP